MSWASWLLCQSSIKIAGLIARCWFFFDMWMFLDWCFATIATSYSLLPGNWLESSHVAMNSSLQMLIDSVESRKSLDCSVLSIVRSHHGHHERCVYFPSRWDRWDYSKVKICWEIEACHWHGSRGPTRMLVSEMCERHYPSSKALEKLQILMVF